MSNFPEQKVREVLKKAMYDLLPDLDNATNGYHPVWDRDFSDEMAEVILHIIKVGNIVEKDCIK